MAQVVRNRRNESSWTITQSLRSRQLKIMLMSALQKRWNLSFLCF